MGWSYSSLKTFQQCPKKYYHIKVVKDVKNQDTVHTDYGKEVHKAAEDFIGNNTPIPEKYAYMKPILSALYEIPGDKFAEMELGVKLEGNKYKPCDFKDEDHWYHGIADLVIIDKQLAWLVDYKTSKNAKYADTKQLDLLAGALFINYPEVREIRAALAFVVSGEFISKNYFFEHTQNYIESMKPDLDRLEGAKASKVWNPISGPLCKFCPVKTCAHNKG
jgi:hypothetical protein